MMWSPPLTIRRKGWIGHDVQNVKVKEGLE